MSRMDIPFRIFALFAAGTVVAQAATDVHRLDAGRLDSLAPAFETGAGTETVADAVACPLDTPPAARDAEASLAVASERSASTYSPGLSAARMMSACLSPQPPPAA